MNHAGKFFFGLSLLMTMFALPCFADTWQSRHITTLYSGVYEGRERLIFRTDNSEMRYLDLTGPKLRGMRQRYCFQRYIKET